MNLEQNFSADDRRRSYLRRWEETEKEKREAVASLFLVMPKLIIQKADFI
jgi:hypothetical protein